MIVVYMPDETRMYENAEEARIPLLEIYGSKLGKSAYDTVLQGKNFRENGGPLVKIVNQEEAKLVREKEVSIGMMT